MTFKTEQEAFWAGEFGNSYIERNQSDALLSANLNLFSKALYATNGVKNCIEFGANIGMNIKAIKLLLPKINASAIEINKKAAAELSKIISVEKIYNTSILDFEPNQTYDLTLIKGVLIHIKPEELPQVYDKLVASCGRYMLVAEYYNPNPVTVTYRGHNDRLFKRDFAGEIMDRHPQLHLIDYGFAYHRDSNFPQDDVTWFLMEKR
jgi:pseudaminic acid biosynthesis-associated methylase